MSDRKFIYIVGPTGTGKTELSVKVAAENKLPVINADSLQIYKLLNIGTAKPTSEEMGEVPHYLFDQIQPPKTLTAAEYLALVMQTFNEKNLDEVVFVGGSGFYIQALEKGLFPKAETPESLKKEIEEWIATKGHADLYKWVRTKDPEAADKISENDHYRIRRAVEVMKTQNKTVTALKEEMKKTNFSPLPDHKALKVGLTMEKAELRSRIELRTQKMLAFGLVDEVQSLIDHGLSSWAPLKSVGYKETIDFLEGSISSKDELFERIVTSTMQLIKKQMTWFKRDPDIHWFDVNEAQRAQEFVRNFYQNQ
ncbi:MAG: tRNA (adenosine(37)-N6)-dimethylallyltransferase MiaA [Bdellovibrionales bacterium]|nr:tRNA (adenosine(37)-N6)-dimethylallyltransferase MiaA [Bdellovibrionales bacterium]